MRETTKDKKRGLQWSLTELLENIDYADDIALILPCHTDMKEKLLELDEEVRKTGLKINVSLKLNHTIEAPSGRTPLRKFKTLPTWAELCPQKAELIRTSAF